MTHTYESISKLLADAKENNLKTFVKVPKENYDLLFADVRIHENELQILLSSYQGRVWQKVISSDEFYAS